VQEQGPRLARTIGVPSCFLWRNRYSAVSIAQRLVGVWRLVSFGTHSPNGPTRYPFGADATGLLIYTASGQMAGQVMRQGRAAFSSPTITRGSDAELAEAATGYIAYAGTYSVDAAAGVVTHHVTMSLFPNLVGTEQRRAVRFDGEHLELIAEEEHRVMILRWQRC
jgi:Lipocalin-like domain